MVAAIDLAFLSFATMMLPALILGLIRKVKARLQNRIGALLWQPLFDLIKLLRKHETLSDTASWIFRFSAAISVACSIYLSVILPWISPKPLFGPCDLFLVFYLFAAMRLFMMLAAMDTASAFGAFAASREATLSFLTEPAAILSFASLAVAAHSSDLNAIFSMPGLHPAIWLMSATAFFLASLVELSRMPIDDPTTHLELTMVHEAMILEASGKNLALFEFSHALKLTILFGLSAQCYLHAFPGLLNLNRWQLSIASIVGLCAIAVLVGVFESVAVKLNWRKAPEFIAYALTFSLIASIVAVGANII